MSTRIERARAYYKRKGFAKTCKKTMVVLKRMVLGKTVWKTLWASDAQLEQWSREEFSYQPKLSILIPMYKTPLPFFKELMDCFQGQIYSNWELCLADGSGEDTEAYEYVKELQKNDDRIRYKRLECNGGISENTNAALDMATGDFIVLCDHDDLVTKDAFYHVVKALNEDKEIDTLYTDEDKVDMDGKEHFDPAFKPDFNVDFFRGGNYICHMFVTRLEIARQVRFKKEYDGAQDFDFIFRCCEASKKVHHIPRLLYHWRCHMNSTAGNPESKLYAYEAGVKAIQAHLDRFGIRATAEMTPFFGYYFVNYQQVGMPKVSLISTEKLSDKVYNAIDYPNMETILISGEYTPENINKAVSERATGEILFFVDPRVQELKEGCFEKLLAPHQREDLASTFAKVSNREGTLYSVGMVTGVRGFFGRSFPAVEEENNGYAMRLLIPQNLSASDLTCAMIKKADYRKVGGMDENLGYICSAVDLYLKMGQAEKLHFFETRAQAVIDAYVDEDAEDEWADFGGISPEDKNRFCEKWPEVISGVDRNYNPNLTQVYGGYVMKGIRELRAQRKKQ